MASGSLATIVVAFLSSTVGFFAFIRKSPPMLIFLGQQSAFRVLSLPALDAGGKRHGGSTFQHRIPRTALFRWPAALPPQDAMAASGGCGPRFPSARARAIGPLEPSIEVSAGGASPVLLWDSVIPDNSLRPQRRGSNLAIVS